MCDCWDVIKINLRSEECMVIFGRIVETWEVWRWGGWVKDCGWDDYVFGGGSVTGDC